MNNIITEYNIKEITIAFIGTLLELINSKEIYTIDDIKTFIINLIETNKLYPLLTNLSFYIEDFNYYYAVDVIFSDLDSFILDVYDYINNKNNNNILFIQNYITPILADFINQTDITTGLDINIVSNTNHKIAAINNIYNSETDNEPTDIDLAGEQINIENFLKLYYLQNINYENKTKSKNSKNKIINYIESQININDLRFRYVIHKHDAERAGTHYDLRIELEKDYVISIAFRYNFISEPYSKFMGILQPLHESYWLTFQGKIKEGYGKGKLKIISKGFADIYYTENNTPILILNDILNNKVHIFAIIKTNNYLLVKTDKIGIYKSKIEELKKLFSN